jgi:hypothetical protein
MRQGKEFGLRLCSLGFCAAAAFAARSASADILSWGAGFTCDSASVVASVFCIDGQIPGETTPPPYDLDPATPIYGCVGTIRCAVPVGTVATWTSQKCGYVMSDGGGPVVDPSTCVEGWGCANTMADKTRSDATGSVSTTCEAAAAYDKLCVGEIACDDKKLCADPGPLAPGTAKLTQCPVPPPDAGGAGAAGSAGAAPVAPASEDDGGCSFVSARRGVGAGFVLLFGLALLAQRRKRA